MTARIPPEKPRPVDEVALFTGQPLSVNTLENLKEVVNHSLGVETTHVCLQCWAQNEYDDGVIRVRHHVGGNATTAVVAFMGMFSSAGGDVTLGGTTYEMYDDVADGPEGILRQVYWTVDVSALATTSTTHELTLDTVVPHSISIYETPNSYLYSSEAWHIDRTFAEANRYITDDADRGFNALLTGVRRARRYSRRHVVNTCFPANSSNGGRISTGGATETYVIGSATADDGMLVHGRATIGGLESVTVTVSGGGGAYSNPMVPCLGQFYVENTGGDTYTVRIYSVYANGDYATATVTGVNAAGWWGAPVTVYVDDTVYVKVTAERTAGAGTTFRLSSLAIWEDFPA